MLNKLLLSLAMAFSLAGCNATLTKKDGTSEVVPDLRKVEADGAALYAAMQSNDATDTPTSREADLLEMASGKLLCEGEYKAVRVDDSKAQMEHIYLILQPEKSKGIQFGRHVRFDFRLGTNDLISITPSSKSCLLVPIEGSSIEESSIEAAYITHLLSNEPTDFHVYLSLYHQKSIYVSTSGALWKIENGKISKSE